MWSSMFVLGTFSWATQYPMYWQIAWHLTFFYPVYLVLHMLLGGMLERDGINETQEGYKSQLGGEKQVGLLQS